MAVQDRLSFKVAKDFIIPTLVEWSEYTQAWSSCYGPLHYSDAKWQKGSALMDV